MTPVMRLSDRIDGHDNNFGLLRLLAAFLVLFGHSFTLLLATPEKPFPPDPVSRVLRHYLPFEEGLPGVGVHIFFFISGFLVTRSFMRSGSVRQFIRARALRIVPAYWVNLLLLAFVMGPLASSLPVDEYLRDPSLRHFIGYDLFFWPMWGELPGVFAQHPVPGAVNGPYWTLPLELQMYGWCLALGLLGFYRRRWLFAVFLAALLVYYLRTSAHLIFLTDKGVPRLWHFFFFGTLACLFADRIRLSGVVLVVGFLPLPLLYLGDMGYYFHLSAALWMSYVILYLAYRRYLPRLDPAPIGDISYGLYLYAFPVQQCLVGAFSGRLDGWTMVGLSLLATLPLAWLSWRYVEQPALKWKRRGGEPSAAARAASAQDPAR